MLVKLKIIIKSKKIIGYVQECATSNEQQLEMAQKCPFKAKLLNVMPT